MRKWFLFFFLVLASLTNNVQAGQLNNVPGGDWYTRNGISCDNYTNFCTPVPADAAYVYQIKLAKCVVANTCLNYDRYLWYIGPDIFSHPNYSMIISHLTAQFSQGYGSLTSARFLKLGTCASNFSKDGKNCEIVLYYYDSQGQYQTTSIAPAQSPIGSFAINNNTNCSGTMIQGICIQKVANTKAVTPLTTGDPININTKEVADARIDLKFPIEFSRIYSSNNKDSSKVGIGWNSEADKGIRIPSLSNPSNGINFSYSTYTASDGTTQYSPATLANTTWVQIQDGTNDDLFFTRSSPTSAWVPAFNNYTGYSLVISNNQFVLTKPNGDTTTYDATTGYIISENFKNGSYLNYYYTGTQLTKIMNNYGQWISFTYSNYANVITQVTASNGDTVQYSYTNGYLTQATYNSVETYTYVYDSNGLMIDKYDENNQHYTHFDYDTQGRPTTNYMFDKDGNQINKTILNYSNASYITETKQNGNLLYHYFSTYNSANQYTQTLNISGGNGFYTRSNKTYDANGNLTTDYNELNTAYTQYTYDANNLVTGIKKENGGTITLTWDTTKRLLLTMTEQTSNGNRITTYTYDSYNNISSKVIQGNNETLTWLYTWSNDGRLITKTEPNGLVYTYYYYAIDGSSSSGMLQSITTSTGKTVTINSYDSRGNATSITGVDGITKTMTYDIRSHLSSETVNGATNSYTYDLAGNLVLVTFANAYQLTMTYDPAHRLIKIEDNNGGMESFTLDATTGKPLNTSIYQNSALIKTMNQVLNTVGDTIKAYRSDSTKPYYNVGSVYNDGSLNSATDANNTNMSRNTYTTGLIKTWSYAGDSITYTYDYDNHISSVSANSQLTNYVYDDFGRLTQLVSPDTGTQNVSYNTGTGVKTRVDGSGITHTTTKDQEGKVTTITHTNPNGTLTENYDYNTDSKLKKITDNTGTTEYFYDTYGFLNKKTQTTNGKSFNVLYENDNLGQTTGITYPSGMIVHYAYSKGFLTNIYVNGTDIIKNVTYNSLEKQPVSWTLGTNTVTTTRNADGGLTNFTDSGMMNQTLTVDTMLNIKTIADSVNSNNNISANFNTNYSISNWTNASGTQSQNTASNFNISTVSGNGANSAWSYVSGSNRINAFTNSPTVTYSYDGNGNLVTDNKGTYVYDLKNNMIGSTRSSGIGTYYFNAMNQRVLKVVNGQLKYFVYNELNQLIGEYDSNGNVISEYIYFGLRPVAVKNNGNIYMVHTDYLGTPRYIMDSSNNLLWKWENLDPYGTNAAQGTLEFNLRFAGQYYDSESGLHYNMFRTYDPNAKRYMQSDPLGLAAGYNTYNYVGRNPLNVVDPLGLNGKNVLIANLYPTEQTTQDWVKEAIPDDTLVIIAETIDIYPTSKDIGNLSKIQGGVFGIPVSFVMNNNDLIKEAIDNAGQFDVYKKTAHGDFLGFTPYQIHKIILKLYPNALNYKKIMLIACNSATRNSYTSRNQKDNKISKDTMASELFKQFEKAQEMWAQNYYFAFNNHKGFGISNDENNYIWRGKNFDYYQEIMTKLVK